MGTLLSFSIAILKTIRHIGAPWLTEAEESAYIHLWRYIGFLIGVRDEYNPCSSLNRAHGAIESIVLHLLHPDRRSQEIANHVIRSVAHRPPMKSWTPAMHAQMARWLLGRPLADALRIEGSFLSYLYTFKVMLLLQLFALIMPLLIGAASTPFSQRLKKICASQLNAHAKHRLYSSSSSTASTGPKENACYISRDQESRCPFGGG